MAAFADWCDAVHAIQAPVLHQPQPASKTCLASLPQTVRDATTRPYSLDRGSSILKGQASPVAPPDPTPPRLVAARRTATRPPRRTAPDRARGSAGCRSRAHQAKLTRLAAEAAPEARTAPDPRDNNLRSLPTLGWRATLSRIYKPGTPSQKCGSRTERHFWAPAAPCKNPRRPNRARAGSSRPTGQPANPRFRRKR